MAAGILGPVLVTRISEWTNNQGTKHRNVHYKEADGNGHEGKLPLAQGVNGELVPGEIATLAIESYVWIGASKNRDGEAFPTFDTKLRVVGASDGKGSLKAAA
jgi:hypothetical protein